MKLGRLGVICIMHLPITGDQMTKKQLMQQAITVQMKVPPHLYTPTIQFYRDMLGFNEITKHALSIGFEIDHVSGISQAETWLEVVADGISLLWRRSTSRRLVSCVVTKLSRCWTSFSYFGRQAQPPSFIRWLVAFSRTSEINRIN